MKKIFFSFLIFFFTNNLIAKNIIEPNLKSKSWILYDVKSLQILSSKASDEIVEPASLTKLMTIYILFKSIKEKKIDINQTTKVSEESWKVSADSSKMFLEPNSFVKISDLINGLIVHSGNDAAITIAELISGKQDSFVKLMNREAIKIGMTQTKFANPHGLSSKNNYTTSNDLLKLTLKIINDFPEFYELFSKKKFTYNKISQNNRNRLLWMDPTVDGIKTGHTKSAGYNLIASSKRLNNNFERRLISIVIGSKSDAQRVFETQKLLNWGFKNFNIYKFHKKNEPILESKIWKGTKDNVKLGFKDDIFLSVPSGTIDKIKPTIERSEKMFAPMKKDSRVGTLRITLFGDILKEMPLISLENINQANIIGRAYDSVRLLFID